MLKAVVLVSGGGTNLQAIIDKIENGTITNTEIAGVISNKADAYALTRAENHGIPAFAVPSKEFTSRDEYNAVLLEKLNELKPDFVILAGYLYILPEQLVKEYAGRIINIHPSLIPSFCGMGFYGLRVHKAVLERGCKVTGATVHFVDEGADTGPIINQRAVYVEPGDTPESLQLRVMEQAEWDILPAAINDYANGKLKIVDGHVVRVD